MLAKPLLLIWSAIMGLRSIFTFLKGSCSWSARGKSNHHLIPHLIADLKSTSHKTLHQPSHTHYKPNLHLSYKLDTLLNLMALAASSQHLQNLMALAAFSQYLQPLHFIVLYLKLWCKSILGSVDAHSIVNCYLLQVFKFLTYVLMSLVIVTVDNQPETLLSETLALGRSFICSTEVSTSRSCSYAYAFRLQAKIASSG